MKAEPVRQPKSFPPLGHKRWILAAGRPDSGPTASEGETVWVLNVSDQDARVEMTLFFADRDPAGPYEVAVAARRMNHIRFAELAGLESPPGRRRGFGCVVDSDLPIVVYHARPGSREADNGDITILAYPDTESVMAP